MIDTVGLALIPSGDTHPAPRAHSERLEKLTLILEALQQPEYSELVVPLPVTEYDRTVLTQVHTPGYIEKLEQYQGKGLDYLDEDTYRSATSFAASCEVTWALLSAVAQSFGGGPKQSLVLGRPPGHHAEADRGMGFCLVNHIAVAARYTLNRPYCTRVAVVDFDIHHGNGTQNIFYDRNDVMYISTHQYPFFPGSGSEDERGKGDGLGFTCNYPLPEGTGDDAMIALFEGDILEQLRKFRPGLILVSAGFDGHHLDPLGGFEMTGRGYRRLAEILKQTANELCNGRLVSLLEGGYDPDGNLDSISNYLKGLAAR
jgi:acetoin utilization deacetylase AcuC-like enzyme